MATWQDMAASDPELATDGERLLRANGDGIAFLATVDGRGAPRVHPVAPLLAAGRLHVFVVNLSPKYRDLLRNGRYALHSMPPPEGGEESYLAGRAAPVEGAARRAEVVRASGGRLGGHEFEVLFELGLDRVLHTRWSGWGTAAIWPEYRRWRPKVD